MTKNNKDYSKGKIYKIEPICDHDEGDIYIGSTTKEYLSQRMTAHKADYKRWKLGLRSNVSSFFLFEKYDVENCRIILIESVNASSFDELNKVEAMHIKNLKCINKKIPTRTQQEYDKIYKQSSKYKDYLITSKEERNKRASMPVTCICGCVVRLDSKSKHEKTKKHLDLMDAKNSQQDTE